jgi:hypothetical protein
VTGTGVGVGRRIESGGVREKGSQHSSQLLPSIFGLPFHSSSYLFSTVVLMMFSFSGGFWVIGIRRRETGVYLDGHFKACIKDGVIYDGSQDVIGLKGFMNDLICSIEVSSVYAV